MWGVVAEKHPIILDSAVQLGAEAFDSCDSSQIIEFNFIAYRGVIKVCFVQQQVNFSGEEMSGVMQLLRMACARLPEGMLRLSHFFSFARPFSTIVRMVDSDGSGTLMGT